LDLLALRYLVDTRLVYIVAEEASDANVRERHFVVQLRAEFD
jgi:hypothetical protein